MDASADVLRTHLADALERRAALHGGAVGERLQARLQALRALPPAPDPAAPARPAGPGLRALAALTADLNARTPALSARRGPARGAALAAEPALLQFFRSTWSRLDTERRLTRSLAEAPENPGPLNSQHLLHQALLHMREASPAYLRHFMAQVDALLWVEQAQAGATAGAQEGGKPAAKKTAAKAGTKGRTAPRRSKGQAG